MIVAPDLPVFRAIADPTRRAILDLLMAGERAVNDLLAPFKMTQPAISQHLKVLREAGLVSERRAGRQRLYRLEPAPLKAVHDWTAHYERYWTQKFTDLGDYLDQLPDDVVMSKSKPATDERRSTKRKRASAKREGSTVKKKAPAKAHTPRRKTKRKPKRKG